MDLSIVLDVFYPGAEWTYNGTYESLDWHSSSPKPPEAELLEKYDEALNLYMLRAIRMERGILLAKSDWTQIVDVNVNKAAWTEYRQALRDLPANIKDIENVVWPTPPQ
jgi:hypothetical protein